MKNSIFIFAFILTSITCTAQTVNRTFQGEIEGVSPFVLHLKVKDCSADGFYKFLTDSLIVYVKGNLDHVGNLSLTGKQNPYPVIEGRLTGRLIEGNIDLSGNLNTHPFYAVDFRGEYSNQYYDYFRMSLDESGYILGGLSFTRNQEVISTFRGANGLIGLNADSLNTTMYFLSDTMVVDDSRGLPLFMSPYNDYDRGGLTFSECEGFWSSESFVEFPEKDKDRNPEGGLRKLDDEISVRMTQIPRSEYAIGKWTAPPIRTYKAITVFTEAKKLLDEKIKPVEEYEPDTGELLSSKVELIYNDGTRKLADWVYDFESYPESFYGYYPELDILVIEAEASGDEIIDFNDSSRRDVGNPAMTATSPDGMWRVTGYYPGGAADTEEWWLEKWNSSLRKYERTADFAMPRYVDGWLWTDNNTVLFKSLYPEGSCFKVELIAETGKLNGN